MSTETHTGCYFWIDCRLPEDERCMSVLCQNCHDELYPHVGGYYDFTNGIGPWDIVCSECKAVLHKHIDRENEVMNEIDAVFDKFLGEDKHE